MGVDRIVRLRDCGIFRDFSWPTRLPDFGRFNLIYGWNATGKTTLSEVFRCLELRRSPELGEAVLLVNGNEIRGADFASATVLIRVFNRRFIDESVFRFDGHDMAPIYVLGKESAEKQNQLEMLRKEFSDAEVERDVAQKSNVKAVNEFDRFCTDRAKVIKDTLKSTGSNPYNNYDKTDYQKRAERMIAEGNAEQCRHAEADRESLLLQHKAVPKAKVKRVEYVIPNLDAFAKKTADLLASSIVTETIKALSQDPELSTWTHDGLRLHRDRSSETCLYCGHLVPPERLASLEAHFSSEYEDLVRRIDELIGALGEVAKAASQVKLPVTAELYENLAQEYQGASGSLDDTLTSVQTYCTALAEALRDKKNQMFRSLQCDVALPQSRRDSITLLNAVIDKHNQICEDFEARVKAAREQLEADLVASDLLDYQKLIGVKRASQAAVKTADDAIAALQFKMTSLEAEIVEYRQPAEDLNKELREYLGHAELQFEAQETGYRIRRNGVTAAGLSEGERTAIALLYFLKSLEDSRCDLKNAVVVLDDPVSSLDSNALYLAFACICDRTKGAGQLFTLTHNFTLFRQVKNWFEALRKYENQHVQWYMLDCSFQGTGRCAAIKELDPLLRDYESEYHYLFACVYRAAHSPPADCLSDSYALPNMARRMFESFLAFHKPDNQGLSRKCEDLDFDPARKRRILRFLHTYSHDDAAAEPEHDPSILSEAGPVMMDLLQMIRHLDHHHYDGMKKLITTHMPSQGSHE